MGEQALRQNALFNGLDLDDRVRAGEIASLLDGRGRPPRHRRFAAGGMI